VALAQMNVLEVHAWGSRAASLETPDRMVFDLDPGEKVAWAAVVEGAHRIRAALERLDLTSFVKTTGGKGLHVVVPLQPAVGWDDVLTFTRAVADTLARQEPTRYTTAIAKAGRTDKILIDYLRNARGATAVSVYSTRARPTAPVSVPVTWDELGPATRSQAFRVPDVMAWPADRPDPWADYFKIRQRLTAARLAQARSGKV
jgi:bifunctional non-homologous end joining protein LigD